MKKFFLVLVFFASCAPKVTNSHPVEDDRLIYWSENRPLRISDFKGSTEKRPFRASTYAGIKLMNPVNVWTGKTKVIVESYFDPELSYFKLSERDSSVLAHEQLHFDMTELYARKLRKQYAEHCSNQYDYFEKRDSIFKKLDKELSIKQDEYDSEVYSERSLQSKWNVWVKKELQELKDYSAKEVPIKYSFFYKKNK